MSIILKSNKIKFKNPISGRYIGINAVTDQSAKNIIQSWLNSNPSIVQDALNNVIILPPDGISGQVLVSNGNGGADWVDLASGDQLVDGDGVNY